MFVLFTLIGVSLGLVGVLGSNSAILDECILSIEKSVFITPAMNQISLITLNKYKTIKVYENVCSEENSSSKDSLSYDTNEDEIIIYVYNYQSISELVSLIAQCTSIDSIILCGKGIQEQFLSFSRELSFPSLKSLRIISTSLIPLTIDLVASISLFSSLETLSLEYFDLTNCIDIFISDLLKDNLKEVNLSYCSYDYLLFNQQLTKYFPRERNFKLTQQLVYGTFIFENGNLKMKFLKSLFIHYISFYDLFSFNKLLAGTCNSDKDSIEELSLRLNDYFLLAFDAVLELLNQLPNLVTLELHFVNVPESSLKRALQHLNSNSKLTNNCALKLKFDFGHNATVTILKPLVLKIVDHFPSATEILIQFPIKKIWLLSVISKLNFGLLNKLTLDFIYEEKFLIALANRLSKIPLIKCLSLCIHYNHKRALNVQKFNKIPTCTVNSLRLKLSDDSVISQLVKIILGKFLFHNELFINHNKYINLPIDEIIHSIPNSEELCLEDETVDVLTGERSLKYFRQEIPMEGIPGEKRKRVE